MLKRTDAPSTQAPISPPRLVDEACVIRIVGTHEPLSGDCMGCINGQETSVWVEHTTWGDPWVTSVCSTCAAKAQKLLGHSGDDAF